MIQFKQLLEKVQSYSDGYLQIGHEPDTTVTLWISNGLRTYYKDTDYAYHDTHSKMFPQLVNSRNAIFGRIDHDQMKISAFVGQTDLDKGEIFSVLYDIRKKYPKYEIMKFGWNNRYLGTFKLNEAYGEVYYDSKSWKKKLLPPHPNYLSIGHTRTGDDKIQYWFTDFKGRLKIYDIPDDKDPYRYGHHLQNTNKSVASGRIDHNKKQISFVPSLNSEALLFSVAYDLQQRYKKFKIYRVADGLGPRVFTGISEDIHESSLIWKDYSYNGDYIDIGHEHDNAEYWYTRGTKRIIKKPVVDDDGHENIPNSELRQSVASGRIDHNIRTISFIENTEWTGSSTDFFSIAYDLEKMYPNYTILNMTDWRKVKIFAG